jgi:hypothetical protein
MKSWKKEFYPLPAHKINAKGSVKDLIEHSLRKWNGLTKENLEKHDLKLDDYSDVTTKTERTTFLIDSSSCALCARFAEDLDCIGCPIYKLNNNSTCGSRKLSLDPYTNFKEGDSNPTMMITMLQKALELEVENEANARKLVG